MLKNSIFLIVIFLLMLSLPDISCAQDIIDVAVKGISDDTEDWAQKDRQEAIMDNCSRRDDNQV
jgi:hypothetical protein